MSDAAGERRFDPNAAAQPGSGVFGLPHGADDAALLLLPVPFDATTSYRPGAADGPAAILSASHQVDLFDRQNGRCYERGIHMLEVQDHVRAASRQARALAEPLIARGGADAVADRAVLARIDALCAQVNDWVERETARWLDAGRLVGVVGGDHAAPFGAIRAVAARHPGCGILHVDAHADLRAAYEGFTWSHASIMANVVRRIPQVSCIAQVGIRDFCEEEFDAIEASAGRVRTWFEVDRRRRLARGETVAAIFDEVVAVLPGEVWVSFDIDGLDPTLCPNTGTPVPGGLGFDDACLLVEAVVESGRRIVGFDLCEVAPGPGPSTWDGDVGARLLYKLCGFTLRCN